LFPLPFSPKFIQKAIVMKEVLLFVGLIFSTLLFSQIKSIYVSDAGNWNNPPWQILKYDENGQNPEIFINSHMAWPQDIVFIDNQNVVLISNLNSGKINKHDAVTGDFISEFATGLGGPTRMKIGVDSLLYVLQWRGDGLVKRYNLNGKFVDNFTDTIVPKAIGFAWDSLGNFYVSSYSGDYIRKFSPTGKNLGKFISNNLVGPTNIWFNAQGEMMVSDYDGNSIKRFELDGTYLFTTASNLSRGEGVDFFPNGDFLIGNGGDGSVKKMTAAGQYQNDFIRSGSGGLIRPNAVIFHTNLNSSLLPNQAKKDLIFPTKGKEFHLNEELQTKIDSVIIINFIGEALERIWYEPNLIISMKLYNPGTYFILCKKFDETIYQQRIIVE
jgi:hypothetical protein